MSELIPIEHAFLEWPGEFGISGPIAGTDLIQELNPVPSYDAINKHTTERRFRGTKEALKVRANQLVAAGGVLRVTFAEEAYPWWVMTVSYQGQNLPGLTTPVDSTQVIRIWSRAKNLIQKDIWGSPKVQNIWERIYDDEHLVERINRFALWRQRIENFLSGRNPDDSVSSISDIVVFSLDLSSEEIKVLTEFVAALSKGVTSYPMTQYVLKRTLLFPIGVEFTGLDTDVLKVYAHTQDLIDNENFPEDSLPWDLPEGIWLKMAPDIEPGNGIWTVTQEFWHADDFETFNYETIQVV